MTAFSLVMIMILVVFTPAVCSAVHGGAPDMEHGESVTSETAPLPGGKVGGGDVTFGVKAAGNVTFSHESHVAGAGLKCTDCHAALYVTKEKHKKATMAQMQKGQSCGACHNGKKAFSVKADCGRCHTK
jgi:c(7)-type cytochrome triheme protein